MLITLTDEALLLSDLNLETGPRDHVMHLARTASKPTQDPSTAVKVTAKSAAASPHGHMFKESLKAEGSGPTKGQRSEDTLESSDDEESFPIPEQAQIADSIDNSRPVCKDEEDEDYPLMLLVKKRAPTLFPREQFFNNSNTSRGVEQDETRNLHSPKQHPTDKTVRERVLDLTAPTALPENGRQPLHDHTEVQGSPDSHCRSENAAPVHGQSGEDEELSTTTTTGKEPQAVEHCSNINPLKRNTPTLSNKDSTPDSAINAVANSERPKRRKKDVEAFRAKVEESRRIMEESIQRAEEERRKTEERQVNTFHTHPRAKFRTW